MIYLGGYAVISEDNYIADAAGHMPQALKNQAEWDFFQNQLNQYDVIILGRKSHVLTPNRKGRKRLILTSSISHVHSEGKDTIYWNPESISFADLASNYYPAMKSFAVTGGQAVFDYFLNAKQGYDAFYLSRLRNVHLIEGRAIFSVCQNSSKIPEEIFDEAGYQGGKQVWLDPNASVVKYTPKLL